MTKYGKIAANGETVIEADECAITGRPVLGWHSVRQQVSGTPYYYRYLSDKGHLLTDELRAELAAGIPKEPIAPTAKKGTKVQDEFVSIEETK